MILRLINRLMDHIYGIKFLPSNVTLFFFSTLPGRFKSCRDFTPRLLYLPDEEGLCLIKF